MPWWKPGYNFCAYAFTYFLLQQQQQQININKKEAKQQTQNV